MSSQETKQTDIVHQETIITDPQEPSTTSTTTFKETPNVIIDPIQDKMDTIINSEPLSSFLLRRNTILSVVLLYFFFGIPIWFKLTEIYRAPLPSSFITHLHCSPFEDLSIHNYVHLKVGDGLLFPDLAEAVQVQVNSELRRIQENDETRLAVKYWNVTLINDLQEIPQKEKKFHDGYTLSLELGDEEGISLDEITKDTTLFYTLNSVKNNDLPFFVTQTLLDHTFKTELELLRLKNYHEEKKKTMKSISYSSKVHLSFKLLSGDGYPIQWEIQEALNEYFGSLVELFAGYVDLSIDSEIKYYTQLNLPEQQDRHQKIKLSDLPAILDFSEWDVSSDQFSYPSLNFILYFPSESQAPLNLEFVSDDNNQAFLIPQWGAIILNKDPLKPGSYIKKEYLHAVLEAFTSELFTLLGLPKEPKNPMIRLDALLKSTIVENLQKGVESLNSLMKLTQSLPNISIPKSVQSNVMKSLEARSESVKSLSINNDFQKAFVESIKCLRFAELAFFDNMMVQQNFFPQEHKIAVYMPLLGPLSMICAIGGLRIVNEIKIVQNKKKEKKRIK